MTDLIQRLRGVQRWIGFDEGACLNSIENYTSYIRENPKHPIYVLASDYDAALEAQQRRIGELEEALKRIVERARSEKAAAPPELCVFCVGTGLIKGDHFDRLCPECETVPE